MALLNEDPNPYFGKAILSLAGGDKCSDQVYAVALFLGRAVKPEKELEKAIKMYLAEHPQAMDTLEGISEWWLMRQHIRIEVTTVRKAISRLVKDDVLEEIGTGEKARYRLKKMAG